jgi:hypothetical protein
VDPWIFQKKACPLCQHRIDKPFSRPSHGVPATKANHDAQALNCSNHEKVETKEFPGAVNAEIKYGLIVRKNGVFDIEIEKQEAQEEIISHCDRDVSISASLRSGVMRRKRHDSI